MTRELKVGMIVQHLAKIGAGKNAKPVWRDAVFIGWGHKEGTPKPTIRYVGDTVEITLPDTRNMRW